MLRGFDNTHNLSATTSVVLKRTWGSAQQRDSGSQYMPMATVMSRVKHLAFGLFRVATGIKPTLEL